MNHLALNMNNSMAKSQEEKNFLNGKHGKLVLDWRKKKEPCSNLNADELKQILKRPDRKILNYKKKVVL